MLETDVLVCGGSCAGLGAPLAAARNSAGTLLIERAGFTRSIITCAGLPYFDGIAHRPTGLIVVRGIALEFLAELAVCEPGAERIDPHNSRIPHTDQFKLADGAGADNGPVNDGPVCPFAFACFATFCSSLSHPARRQKCIHLAPPADKSANFPKIPAPLAPSPHRPSASVSIAIKYSNVHITTCVNPAPQKHPISAHVPP